MKRTALRLLTVAMLSVALTVPMTSAEARPSHDHGLANEIDLPTGFLPEGITIGPGPYAYFGSRADGDIYAVDLRSGEGAVMSQGPGTPSVGLKSDQRDLLYVAGGVAGNARVVNLRTGQVLQTYQFSPASTDPANPTTFVNDVVLTSTAAWFTDSRQPKLYRVPLARNGRPAPTSAVEVLPLGPAWVQNPGTNANGITETPDGRGLLVVNTSNGMLYRVDPDSGRVRPVDLDGAVLTAGDGMLLIGRTLYVVQNRENQVAVIKLNRSGTEGRVTARLTNPLFDVPTTVAAYRDSLFLPNARFTTPQLPTTTFTAVRIDRR